ncbi:transposase domain-containing protein [Escherichia coli]
MNNTSPSIRPSLYAYERYLHHVLDVIADWPVNRLGALLPWRVTLPA